MSDEGKRQVRPWDLFNKNMGRTPSSVQQERMSICKSCPFYRKSIDQCKKCGCIMNQKTKLADASCPVGKWDAHHTEENATPYDKDLDDD
jgi:hypothetical protein